MVKRHENLDIGQIGDQILAAQILSGNWNRLCGDNLTFLWGPREIENAAFCLQLIDFDIIDKIMMTFSPNTNKVIFVVSSSKVMLRQFKAGKKYLESDQ